MLHRVTDENTDFGFGINLFHSFTTVFYFDLFPG